RCLRQDRSPVPSVIDPIGANPAKHDPAFGSTRSITNRLRPSSNIRHEGAGQRATPGLARGCGPAVVAWVSLVLCDWHIVRQLTVLILPTTQRSCAQGNSCKGWGIVQR